MSRRTVVAGNWKMNKTAAETSSLTKALVAQLADVDPAAAEIVVCPPFTSIAAAAGVLAGTRVRLGAQNVHWAESGAYTGEISAAMLKDAGVEYVIIGHSERRQYFGETDGTVNLRLKAALNAALKPIVCVGETLQEREGGRTERVLAAQLDGGLADLSASQVSGLILAYEPVWAIGTGRTATPEAAEETHRFIRSHVAGKFGRGAADALVILYGGSMKPENAAALCAQPDVDGGLIGGASLKADSFAQLVRNAVSGAAH